MKKIILNLINFILFAFLLAGCGDSGTTGAKNQYIGASPGIAQSYSLKIEDLEDEQKKASDFEKAKKLENEIDALEEEAKAKIEKVEAALGLPIEVPFEGDIDNEKYTVDKLTITGIRYNELEITVEITSKVTRAALSAYLQALDSDGNPLMTSKDWAVLTDWNWRESKEGKPATLKGYFLGLEKLENLEKFLFQSRVEYEKHN